MFDCVMPTRNGRNALAFTGDGPIRLRNAKHRRDTAPIESGCACYCCANYSRAYLHHLFAADEMLGPTLLSLHNLAGLYQQQGHYAKAEPLFRRSLEIREAALGKDHPTVAETLGELATRHRLILVTKGNHAEQADKLARSGLASFFNAVEIVPEKDPETYRTIIARHELVPHSGWMIGNSPKSDINPALAAGLHAVFLFHKDTWALEHAEIDGAPEGQHLIELESFARLGSIF